MSDSGFAAGLAISRMQARNAALKKEKAGEKLTDADKRALYTPFSKKRRAQMKEVKAREKAAKAAAKAKKKKEKK